MGTAFMLYNAYIGLVIKYAHAGSRLSVYFLIKKHKARQTKNQVE
jgi:hypothetical protein